MKYQQVSCKLKEPDMNNNHFPELKTERLLLRKLNTSDWEMISYLRSDKIINEFIKRPSAESEEKAIEFITNTNNGVHKKNIYYWSIVEKNNTQMIGSICLWNFF